MQPDNRDIDDLEKRVPENYTIFQPLLLASCIAIGMMFGYKMNENIEGPLISTANAIDGNTQMVGRVEELMRFIDYKYVDTVDRLALEDEAINAIVAKLDPHSSYMTPSEVLDASEEMNGKYYGVGIENFNIDDTICIYKVIENGPAAKAGLKPLDRLISINDTIVAGKKMPYDQVRDKLRRTEGTNVKLGILRNGQKMTFNVKVGLLSMRTVQTTLLPDAQAAVIKIDRFGAKTYTEFMEEIEAHFIDSRGGGGPDKKAKHLIIDLRDNPGGYLPEATNILCQIFEDKEKLLVYTEGKTQKKNEYKTTGKRFFKIDQVVVLINENSASASEIVAGAIQDWDRGFIIGRRSYGKGLVQEQYDLKNGGALRLTVSRYYTPSGRSIQREYDNIDRYYNDGNERMTHGDLFHADSNLVKNTSTFKTLTLGRPVKSIGGISPDIFVGMDTFYRNEDFRLLRSYIPEFLCKYGSSNVLPSTADGIDKWQAPKGFYERMLSFVATKEGKTITIPVSKLTYLNDDIKAAFAHIYMDKKTAAQFLSKQDKFITTAKDALSGKHKLK